MMGDYIVRCWWTFQFPEAVIHVPADSEVEARASLMSWLCKEKRTWAASAPLTSTRVTTREVLARSLVTTHPPQEKR